MGMAIPTESPVGTVWDGYGHCDESRWACGHSVEIFERM